MTVGHRIVVGVARATDRRSETSLGERCVDVGGAAGTVPTTPSRSTGIGTELQRAWAGGPFSPAPERFFPALGFDWRSVTLPVQSGISKRFCRHTSQEVCPWNAKFSRAASEPAFTPRAELVEPDIAAFTAMDDAEFKARFGDTPLMRAKRMGLARNAAAVLGGLKACPTN